MKVSNRVGLFSMCFAMSFPVVAEETLRIATVSNPDMERMQKLSPHFTKANPDIKLDWVVLDENSLRQKVTTDIATKSGQFDIVTIGAYETPLWAKQGWLVDLKGMPAEYDAQDIFPAVRESLSYEGGLYAAPFYAESSFTMYRSDLFDSVELVMPEQPSWDFIESAAAKISAKHTDVNGICLRGKVGWGENMALIMSMANSYGARLFDMEWQPELTGDAWGKTINDYTRLLQKYGPEQPEQQGFKELLNLFKDGKCAIWIDATVAASAITDPATSSVADKVAFASAPDAGLGKKSNWLWSWALGVSNASEKQEAAKRFVQWATSKEYIELVAASEGWSNVPPGTRQSLYQNQDYLAAAPFAELTLSAILSAEPNSPAVQEVPYKGIQFADIPEFTGIGTAIGSQVARALKGDISVSEAQENAQWVTSEVMSHAHFIGNK